MIQTTSIYVTPGGQLQVIRVRSHHNGTTDTTDITATETANYWQGFADANLTTVEPPNEAGDTCVGYLFEMDYLVGIEHEHKHAIDLPVRLAHALARQRAISLMC